MLHLFLSPTAHRPRLRLFQIHICFCDFAALVTNCNSTPRELQKLLECFDCGERLQLLWTLLKREAMLCKREEVMAQVDVISREDGGQYLRVMLHATQRLLQNQREGAPGADGEEVMSGAGALRSRTTFVVCALHDDPCSAATRRRCGARTATSCACLTVLC